MGTDQSLERAQLRSQNSLSLVRFLALYGRAGKNPGNEVGTGTVTTHPAKDERGLEHCHVMRNQSVNKTTETNEWLYQKPARTNS